MPVLIHLESNRGNSRGGGDAGEVPELSHRGALMSIALVFPDTLHRTRRKGSTKKPGRGFPGFFWGEEADAERGGLAGLAHPGLVLGVRPANRHEIAPGAGQPLLEPHGVLG